MSYIIYEYIHNPTGKPMYVGQTCNPKKRDSEHRRLGKTLIEVELKNFPEDFEFCVLKSGLNAEDADYWEIYYMIAHKTWIGFGGYNQVLGNTLSLDTIKKISDNHALSTGASNPFYGRKHSDRTRQKIAESHRHPNLKNRDIDLLALYDSGKNFNGIAKEFNCSRSAISRRYHFLRPFDKLNTRSHGNAGANNGRYGKLVSLNTRIKISNANRKHFHPFRISKALRKAISASLQASS